jgi:hypothetical protein
LSRARMNRRMARETRGAELAACATEVSNIPVRRFSPGAQKNPRFSNSRRTPSSGYLRSHGQSYANR